MQPCMFRLLSAVGCSALPPAVKVERCAVFFFFFFVIPILQCCTPSPATTPSATPVKTTTPTPIKTTTTTTAAPSSTTACMFNNKQGRCTNQAECDAIVGMFTASSAGCVLCCRGCVGRMCFDEFSVFLFSATGCEKLPADVKVSRVCAVTMEYKKCKLQRKNQKCCTPASNTFATTTATTIDIDNVACAYNDVVGQCESAGPCAARGGLLIASPAAVGCAALVHAAHPHLSSTDFCCLMSTLLCFCFVFEISRSRRPFSAASFDSRRRPIRRSRPQTAPATA
jgi:hypothetical protein